MGLPPTTRGIVRRKSQSLDDLAAIGTPQPSTSGDERMRNGKRQRAARKRQTIFDQMRAELRQ